MTDTEDLTPPVAGLAPPIDLEIVGRDRLAFYLAGRAPVAIGVFADGCTQDPSAVRRAIATQFDAEVTVDDGGVIRVSDVARNLVTSAGRDVLEAGQNHFDQGTAAVERGDHDDAVPHLRAATSSFASLRDRFAAVGYEPEKLDRLATTAARKHDDAAKTAAKSVVKYQATRFVRHGDAIADLTGENPTAAANEYKRGHTAVTTAIEAATEYNESRLHDDSPRLDVGPLVERRDTFEEEHPDLATPSADTPDTTTEAVDASFTDTDSVETDTPPPVAHDPDPAESPSSPPADKDTPTSSSTLNPDHADESAETNPPDDPTEADVPSPLRQLGADTDHLTPTQVRLLAEAGYTSLDDLATATPSELTAVRLIGPAAAERILETTRAQTDVDVSSSSSPSTTVSTTEASSGSESDAPTTVASSSTESNSADSDRLDERAFHHSWETIPDNQRVSGQFLARVVSVNAARSESKSAEVILTDRTGHEVQLNEWETHDLDIDWAVGEWYALEHARGKVWGTDSGTPTKRLSTTKDFAVIELGSEFDPDTGRSPAISPEGTASGTSITEQLAARGSHETDSATTNASSSSEPATADESPEADTPADDIFDDIMDEFDGL